jgi:hypothetical protein
MNTSVRGVTGIRTTLGAEVTTPTGNRHIHVRSRPVQPEGMRRQITHLPASQVPVDPKTGETVKLVPPEALHLTP